MTEQIKPALDAERWADIRNKVELVEMAYGARTYVAFIGAPHESEPGAPAVHVDPRFASDLAPLMALTNTALPSDSPYKITREDVNLILDIRGHLEVCQERAYHRDREVCTWRKPSTAR